MFKDSYLSCTKNRTLRWGRNCFLFLYRV